MAYTATDGAFVEFQRVQKSYDGEILVVKDLNLALPKGGGYSHERKVQPSGRGPMLTHELNPVYRPFTLA